MPTRAGTSTSASSGEKLDIGSRSGLRTATSAATPAATSSTVAMRSCIPTASTWARPSIIGMPVVREASQPPATTRLTTAPATSVPTVGTGEQGGTQHRLDDGGHREQRDQRGVPGMGAGRGGVDEAGAEGQDPSHPGQRQRSVRRHVHSFGAAPGPPEGRISSDEDLHPDRRRRHDRVALRRPGAQGRRRPGRLRRRRRGPGHARAGPRPGRARLRARRPAGRPRA